ncbi:hypothetical protein [Algoriphagus aquimarinus]|mgnify:CR=1 FL=1|uniref:hypothetical protein n=1 Tax=Algoriphagus aquimarinus TaxID=237018 RepID=UPI0030DD351B|tara:strand:- start:4981 stop:5223 length:243 start_codon:yes stop_codon:yes gene_type:complete
MFDHILGSVFFEFIGAFSKWIVYAAIYKMRGKKVISFNEMWGGKKNSKRSDILMHGFSNIILGLLIVVGFLVLAIKIGKS